MSSRLLATSQCALALGLCLTSSGCIFLGAYPVVQDVTGPLRNVRVVDSESKEDVPEAKATLTLKGESLVEPFLTMRIEDHDNPEYRLDKRGFKDGFLTRGKNGIFEVRKHSRICLGTVGLTFADGTSYFGPFNKNNDGVFKDEALITAWAPGYMPLQVAYHVPSPNRHDRYEGDRNGGQYGCDYDPTGILTLYLCRTHQKQASTLKQVSADVSGCGPVTTIPVCVSVSQ
jgi:hypothetical protein